MQAYLLFFLYSLEDWLIHSQWVSAINNENFKAFFFLTREIHHIPCSGKHLLKYVHLTPEVLTPDYSNQLLSVMTITPCLSKI